MIHFEHTQKKCNKQTKWVLKKGVYSQDNEVKSLSKCYTLISS